MADTFFDITPELLHLADVCKSNSGIDPQLFSKYEVKGGFAI